LFLPAYAGAARAFGSYQVALEIFAETAGAGQAPRSRAGARAAAFRGVRCRPGTGASGAGHVPRRQATAE